jgi:hypothetical protein
MPVAPKAPPRTRIHTTHEARIQLFVVSAPPIPGENRNLSTWRGRCAAKNGMRRSAPAVRIAPKHDEEPYILAQEFCVDSKVAAPQFNEFADMVICPASQLNLFVHNSNESRPQQWCAFPNVIELFA